jgi:hypothetical protein
MSKDREHRLYPLPKELNATPAVPGISALWAALCSLLQAELLPRPLATMKLCELMGTRKNGGGPADVETFYSSCAALEDAGLLERCGIDRDCSEYALHPQGTPEISEGLEEAVYSLMGHISTGPMHVAFMLAQAAGANGTVRFGTTLPTRKELEVFVGLRRQHIQRHLQALKDIGFVASIHERTTEKANKPNTFEILLNPTLAMNKVELRAHRDTSAPTLTAPAPPAPTQMTVDDCIAEAARAPVETVRMAPVRSQEVVVMEAEVPKAKPVISLKDGQWVISGGTWAEYNAMSEDYDPLRKDPLNAKLRAFYATTSQRERERIVAERRTYDPHRQTNRNHDRHPNADLYNPLTPIGMVKAAMDTCRNLFCESTMYTIFDSCVEDFGWGPERAEDVDIMFRSASAIENRLKKSGKNPEEWQSLIKQWLGNAGHEMGVAEGENLGRRFRGYLDKCCTNYLGAA